MSGSDAPTHKELSAMKVDELRNICGELGVMVSGKKADLIDRILAQYEPKDAVMVGSDISQDIVKDSPETEVGDACLLYTSPSPRDNGRSRMPSSA